MIVPFENILSSALTPITLISGVGLVMLCMTNRYNHTVDRTRELLSQYQAHTDHEEPDLLREIHIIHFRSQLLRSAILCIALSAMLAGLLIATNIFSAFQQVDLSTLAAVWLCLALLMIITATVLFAMEATYSLHALALEVHHLPEHTEQGTSQ